MGIAGPSETTLGAGDAARRQAHFEALVESSEDAILSKDVRGVITSWNPAAERLYHYSAEEAIGQSISLIIPEDHANEEKEILARILAGERLHHYETERVRKDGARVSVSLTISPIRDQADTIIGASVVAWDISESVIKRERAEHLHAITSALAREAEPERATKVLLADGIAALGADAAALGMLDPSGERIVLEDAVGHDPETLEDWRSFAVGAEVPMSAAVRTLTAIWSPTPEDLVQRFPSLAEAEIRFGALAALPLAVEGKPLGAIAFSFARPRQFGAEEKAFVGAVVQQAAHSLERTRIHDLDRRARQRFSFLAGASEVLNEPLEVDETLERLAELSVRHMSDWCSVELLQPDGELRTVVIEHVDRSKVELAREFRRRYPPDPEARSGSMRVIRTSEPELYERISEEMLAEAARDDEHLEMMRTLGIESAMIVPLVARKRTLGTMTFASADPEEAFGEEDLQLAQDLARRAALAIDTSVLYHREHETALTLQRALLPEKLPEVETVELAARYLPAEAGLEVGGDWYDVIRAPAGRLEVVIGDVAGRGIPAAAVMGRLASALRAFALDGRPVDDAVTGLDELMHELEPGQMTTLFQLSLELSSGRARYVRAGHPPALLRLADGEVSELSGVGSPPLGVLGGARFVANAITLPAGSTILLYTDGLIERRQLDLQVGIERLKEAFAAAADQPESIVEEIPRALGAERVPDDIALLAARFRGAGD